YCRNDCHQRHNRRGRGRVYCTSEVNHCSSSSSPSTNPIPTFVFAVVVVVGDTFLVIVVVVATSRTHPITSTIAFRDKHRYPALRHPSTALCILVTLRGTCIKTSQACTTLSKDDVTLAIDGYRRLSALLASIRSTYITELIIQFKYCSYISLFKY
ncbi:hypothetical protein Fcan01_23231, partial [Folsomia candida]